MLIDADKVELVALDPTKTNVLVLHLGPRATMAEVQSARALCDALEAKGVTVSLILPSDWRVEFAEVEKLSVD